MGSPGGRRQTRFRNQSAPARSAGASSPLGPFAEPRSIPLLPKRTATTTSPFQSLQSSTCRQLFDLTFSARGLDFGLELLGFIFRNALLDRLRKPFHKILGFLQPQTRGAADNLDDGDLVVAG